MNNASVSVRPRVDADTLKDVLIYSKALLKQAHVQGVFVTRRCDGSNKLLIQIAVTDAVYDIYNSDKMGFLRLHHSYGDTFACLVPDMTPRERIWAMLDRNEDPFVWSLRDDWREANWMSDNEPPFADDYKDHFDLNFVRLSTSSNFIQKGTVTFQSPLSEVAIWRLFDS
ncbi:MAG: hypothetical protein JWM07_862 [Candidatus Saccharibacteria bacterium]|nr:hypothetical protein [Candidatus Saccharibacteria bacterium]